MSHVRLATIAGLVLAVALGGLTGWLGFRAYESHKTEELRSLFVQVGRQGALNLTTIDHQQADADVQRILDSATGTFYDDFQRRAQPVIDVVKQAQSKSVGTISEAGLESESESGDEAQVLVAVTVKTSNAGAPEQSRGPGGCGSQCRRWVTRPRSPTWSSCRDRASVNRADDKNDSPDDTVKETTTVPVDTDTERTEEQCERAGKGGRGAAEPAGASRPSAASAWSKALAYGVLPAVALLLAAAAGFLKWQDNSVRNAEIARVESVQAARDSTIALLSTSRAPWSSGSAPHATCCQVTFRDSYASLTNDVGGDRALSRRGSRRLRPSRPRPRWRRTSTMPWFWCSSTRRSSSAPKHPPTPRPACGSDWTRSTAAG